RRSTILRLASVIDQILLQDVFASMQVLILQVKKATASLVQPMVLSSNLASIELTATLSSWNIFTTFAPFTCTWILLKRRKEMKSLEAKRSVRWEAVDEAQAPIFTFRFCSTSKPFRPFHFYVMKRSLRRINMFKDTKKLIGTDTLIGQGTVVEGNILTEANLRIEGEFHGEITTKGDIIVGEFGVAQADISCVTLTIAGQVQGNVTVSGRLIITPSGQLNGNALVHSIIVQEGGAFNGECQMNTAIKSELSTIQKSQEDKQDKHDKQEKAKARQAG